MAEEIIEVSIEGVLVVETQREEVGDFRLQRSHCSESIGGNSVIMIVLLDYLSY